MQEMPRENHAAIWVWEQKSEGGSEGTTRKGGEGPLVKTSGSAGRIFPTGNYSEKGVVLRLTNIKVQSKLKVWVEFL